MDIKFIKANAARWYAEAIDDGRVVARARIETNEPGEPQLTRLLLLDDDASHVVTLLEAIDKQWPNVEWVPRIQEGDSFPFERFFFLQHLGTGPYAVVGVLQHGVTVRLGLFELTNAQLDRLALHPMDFYEVLGLET